MILYVRYVEGGTVKVIKAISHELKTSYILHHDLWLVSAPSKRYRSHGVQKRLECSESLSTFRHDLHERRVDDFEELYELLTRCPDVREVEMGRFHHGGCVIRGNQDNFFKFQKEDRFPPLTNLTVLGYNWEHQPGLPSDTRRNSPLNIQQWDQAMDWSRLKRLHIDRPPEVFLDTFYGRLTNLEELEILPQRDRWRDEHVLCDLSEPGENLRVKLNEFVSALPPLRRLQIGGTGKHLNLTKILQRHGPSLTELGFYEYENACRDGCWNYSRPFLSNEDLKILKSEAPSMSSLSLDVARNGTVDYGDWPWEYLELIGDLPQVVNLSLNFDSEDLSVRRRLSHCREGRHFDSWLDWDEDTWLRCSTPEQIKPELTTDEALKLFRFLQSKKKGRPLQYLTFPTESTKYTCKASFPGFDGRNLGACCTQIVSKRGVTRVCEDARGNRLEHEAYSIEVERKNRALRHSSIDRTGRSYYGEWPGARWEDEEEFDILEEEMALSDMEYFEY